ncbi:FlaD/FlaE family flagellar protein [Salinigranum sp.]|uniref:FlaD/FlaE family flagellar protein n=1 Tax=Salinigranum sp. TaxID=1966351 RepID=UPI0035666D48
MNVNPEDYDPEELRRMAADRRDRDHPERHTDGHSGAEAGGPGEETQPRWDGPDDDPPAGFERRNGRRDQYDGRAGRSRARSPDRGNPGPTRGVAADALRSNQLEQLFLHQSAMVAEEMTKPYLDSLPQKYAAERVIFDWLEFLVLKGGFKRTMDALRYYRTIQWITPDVEDALQDYLVGFTEDGQGSHDLDVDDHQLSLLYVARLASMS